jgi:hypothetical protein
MGSKLSMNELQEGYVPSRRGSNASNIGLPMMSMNRRGSNASQLPPSSTIHGLAAPGGPRMGRRPSAMMNPDPYISIVAPQRRASAFGPSFTVGKVVPDDANMSVNLLVHGPEDGSEEYLETSWRALPKWWTDVIPNYVTATVSLTLLTGMTLFVLVESIIVKIHA